LLAAPSLAAQSNPVVGAVRMMATQTGKSILDAAREMPADKYAFKPTPAHMSFAELIIHIQDDSRKTCGAMSSAAALPPQKLASTESKEQLVAALKGAIDYCGTVLSQAKDARLGDQVTWYGTRTTRAMAFVGLVADWSDHYAQAALYLRLNGLVPPTARP
jgi:uncharacterized damage-inducible protein DinB